MCRIINWWIILFLQENEGEKAAQFFKAPEFTFAWISIWAGSLPKYCKENSWFGTSDLISTDV